MPRSRHHPKPPDKATRRRLAEQVLRDYLPHFAVLDGHLVYHPEQQTYELTAAGVRVLKTFAISRRPSRPRLRSNTEAIPVSRVKQASPLYRRYGT
jgi:hypothetical protein